MEDMSTRTANCCHCGSTNTIRHGYTAKSKQRYRCHDCGRCFVEGPAPPTIQLAKRRSSGPTTSAPPCEVSAASSAFHAIPLRGGSKKAAELPPLEQTLAPPAAA